MSNANSVELDFGGRPEALRSVVDGERLRFAYQSNPTFATEISRIEPLPHQHIAVYEHMLPQPRLRFLLADDAGAGKTIMTGLYIREMLSRGLLRRALIIPPAGLVGNWQRELQRLFQLDFRIVSGADAADDNPFSGSEGNQVIVSVDTLARGRAFDRLGEEETEPYDLVVFDEAHKLSARRDVGYSIQKTQRYKLAEAIAGVSEEQADWTLPWETHHLLLLTATPHMGKDFPYYCLWRLLQPDALPTKEAFEQYPDEARDRHFLRRTKEEMVDEHGDPIYPTRVTKTTEFSLTDREDELYERTTNYLNEYYNRAAVLNRSAVRLAMTVFQRRMASSTYALLRSLERRRDKINRYIEAVETAQMSMEDVYDQERLEELEDVFDALTADEEVGVHGRELNEQREDRILEAVAAHSINDLREEREQINDLIGMARNIYESGDSSKFSALLDVLQNPEYEGEKMLIFTEHRDTLTYLVHQLEELGYTDQIASIHGGMPYEERDEQQAFFRKPIEDGGARYMVATDAAGEGINLQFCWLMVNYDVPWNPARLEQRMGRIHRFGQEHDPVVITNMVSTDTREDAVVQRLLSKLEHIRDELGHDKVFDVVGELLGDVSIQECIQRALEDEAEAVGEVDRQVTVERMREVEERHQDVYGDSGDVREQLPAWRERREERRFRKVIPGRVQQYIRRSVPFLDLEIEGDLDGTFSLKATRDGALDPLLPVLQRRGTDARHSLTTHPPGFDDQDEDIWIHPGEPVFDRIHALVEQECGNDARRGALFRDPRASRPYALFLATIRIMREADPSFPSLAQRERRTGRLVGFRVQPGDDIETCSPERLLLLHPQNDMHPDALDLIGRGRELQNRARRVAETGVASEMVEAEQSKLQESLDERVRFLERGFRERRAALADERNRLRREVDDGVRGAEREYEAVRRAQQQLQERREEVVGALHREIELIQTGRITFVANAIVIPTNDPKERKQVERDTENRAMEEVIAYERVRGAREVIDVSTPPKARDHGLDEDYPGFDLISYRSGEPPRAIEVKGRSGLAYVTLEANEWEAAASQREDYWLYVVYHCETDSPDVYPVQNPVDTLAAQPLGGVRIAQSEILQSATDA